MVREGIRERWVRRGRNGQSSVEYALVLMAFLSMVLALGVVWHAAQSGRLLELARDASSHNAGGGEGIGFLQDVTSY